MGLGILMAIWVRKLKDDEIYGFKYKLVKFWGLGINVKTEWNWIGLMTHILVKLNPNFSKMNIWI